MKIVFILLGMLLVCRLSGEFLIYALRANGSSRWFAMHIGYAYTLVAFYVIYMQFSSAYVAAIGTTALPLSLAIFRWLSERRGQDQENRALSNFSFGALTNNLKTHTYPVAISILITLLAAWPYLLSGWGTYWHSGNRDMEDGLNGRDAYINNLIVDSHPFDLGEIIGDKSWYDFAKVTGTLAKAAHKAESYKQWYAGDGFRFQYSSLAFWSSFFDELHGIDILLVQALLNLILMSIGIFHLSRHAFAMSPLASAVAAVVSVGGTFYLTTYFAGHVGSLMYGAMIPALLYLVMTRDQTDLSMVHAFVFCGLLTGAIAFAYPHPLAILVLPLLVYWMVSVEAHRNRIANILKQAKGNPLIVAGMIVFIVIVLGISLSILWQATEGYRLRQDGQYRAWGYTHVGIIVPLFLGLIPSPMEGSLFLGSALGEQTYWIFIFFSSLLAGTVGVVYFASKASRNFYFFTIFGLFWIIEYFIFRYFVVDSYYLYKFLYTHQFIFVIGITAFVFRTHSRAIKLVCSIILLANIGSVLAMAHGVYHRPYNEKPEQYQKLLSFDHTVLQKSFVELTGGSGIAVRQTLKANGIETIDDPRFADYFIVPSGRDSDITGSQFTETLAETGGLAVKRSPEDNYLMVRTWQDPEHFSSDPILKDNAFRWVGDGKNDNLGIYVIRPKLTNHIRNKFLRICFQRGPSSENKINITVSAAGKNVLRGFVLNNDVRCEWIPASQVINAEQPLVIRSGAKGKSLLPHDDRILLYRVFAVGWADRAHDDNAIPFFNAAEDIVKPTKENIAVGTLQPSTLALHIGSGWESYESYAGETFRWATESAEIILSAAETDGVASVTLDLEPGPSHGSKSLDLEVLDQDGNLLFRSRTVTGRNSVVLPLRYSKLQTSLYKLRSRSENLAVAGDSRILNYRVFSITLQKN